MATAQRKTTTTKADTHDDLIVASRVRGTPVFNEQGDRIGHVEDLSIERESGTVRYALMSIGGFLGLGDRLHPLPWRVLRYDPDQGGYVVPLTKEALRDAPHYTPAEIAAYGGRDLDYRARLFAYYEPYGVVPYW